jgi:hypothetical protein
VGLPPALKVIAEGVIKASTVMVGARNTTIALFHEWDRPHGMTGGDDAGSAFAGNRWTRPREWVPRGRLRGEFPRSGTGTPGSRWRHRLVRPVRPAGMSDRLCGSPEKLRDVAGSWGPTAR